MPESGDYAVIVSAGPCQATSECMIATSSRETALQEQQASIFPNPFRDFLQVDLSETAIDGCELIVFDSRGKLVRRLHSAGAAALWIPASDWPAGLYLLTLHYQGRTRSFRVVKE